MVKARQMFEVLEAVDGCGSINQASKELGITYRWCWIVLNKIKDKYGRDIVISEIGGNNRGSTVLTEKGKKVLNLLKGK